MISHFRSKEVENGTLWHYLVQGESAKLADLFTEWNRKDMPDVTARLPRAEDAVV